MPENCENSTSGNPFGFHFVAANISQTNDSNKSFGTRKEGGGQDLGIKNFAEIFFEALNLENSTTLCYFILEYLVPTSVIPLASTLSLQTLVKPTTLTSLSEHGGRQGFRNVIISLRDVLTFVMLENCENSISGNPFGSHCVAASISQTNDSNKSFGTLRGRGRPGFRNVIIPYRNARKCLLLLTFVMPENCENSTSGNPFGFHFVVADISETNDSSKSFGTWGQGGEGQDLGM
ncbi:hypothetical protein CEXT_592651 [Caerostris extrusa]|uniref:Uncharacterized protein n=1 Tax=Caerostris extrusa TaxID=172846 RepID=A0AAV4YA93_CAEEX|nr:hypothetical protein CEXT_592651 [Caerostris extrusa]